MKILQQLGVATGVLFSRLGMLPANVSPLGSFGFFSRNPLYFVASIVIFDLAWGGLYKGYWFTYLGFAAYWILGRVAGNNATRQAVLLPLASLAFFLFSNLGSWWYWYPHTWEGLALCLTLAIPFYKATLLGDMLFGYGYLALRHMVKVLHTSPHKAFSA